MTDKNLLNALTYVDHTRQKRAELAKMVLQHPHLITSLLEQAKKDQQPLSSRACWVLEFSLKEDLSLIYPYLDIFIEVLPKISLEPSVRPMAKICEQLTLAYFKKKDATAWQSLQEVHLKSMATVCFDWLIGPHKVAPKAFSMTSLYHLGSLMPWIHEELKLILEREYAKGSAAYKARARVILNRL